MSDDRNPSIIKVTGKGMVKQSAEVGEFRIEIQESGDDSVELMQLVVARHNGVIEALKKHLTNAEITTRGPWVRRHEKEWWSGDEEDTPPPPAYDGATEIWVSTEKLDLLGQLMARAMAAGANAVSVPKFAPKDIDAMTIEAVASAAEAAKMRAETVAGTLGLTLGHAIKLESHADGSSRSGDMSIFLGSQRALSFGGPPHDDWDVDEPAIVPPELVMTQYVEATFTVLEPER